MNETIMKPKNETMMKPNLLDISGAAFALGVTDRMVRRLVEQRRIRVYKVGKHVRIAQSDIAEYLQSNMREVREL
jgi:excisionase family DNA binding protein